MNDCLFCKIANGMIPTEKLYEDDKAVVIRDINPQAKLHYLLIPKEHFDDIADAAARAPETVAHLFGIVASMREKLGFQNGFRVISNIGEDGCQSVKHLHIHLLGGEKLADKMG